MFEVSPTGPGVDDTVIVSPDQEDEGEDASTFKKGRGRDFQLGWTGLVLCVLAIAYRVLVEEKWGVSIEHQKKELQKKRCKGFFGKLKCFVKAVWVAVQIIVRFFLWIFVTIMIFVNVAVAIKATRKGADRSPQSSGPS